MTALQNKMSVMSDIEDIYINKIVQGQVQTLQLQLTIHI